MEAHRRISSIPMGPLCRIYLHGQPYQHSNQVREQNSFGTRLLGFLHASFFAGGNAVISLIFAEYLNRLFWHSTRAEVSPDDIPQWAIKLTAVAAVLVVSAICVATPTLGSRAAVVFTTVKVGSGIYISSDVPILMNMHSADCRIGVYCLLT